MIDIKIFLLKNSLRIAFLMSFVAFSLQSQELKKDPDKPSKTELQSEQNKEEAGRERVEAEAEKDVIKALQAFKNDSYEESINLYLSAISKLDKASDLSQHVDDKITNIKQNMAIVYHYWARDIAEDAERFYDQKKFDEATRKAAEAIKMDPSLAKRMERLVKRFQKQKTVAIYKEETDEALVDANKETRLHEIDILMAQGRALYKEGLWHRAREKFEEVLILDPYNLPAVEMIKKLTKKMFSAGKQRYETTVQERDAEAIWSAVTPLIPRALEPESKAPSPIKRNLAGNRIKKKLEEIMIEHMEFEDATIPAVIKALRYEAKQQDKDKEGVNIILRMLTVASGGGGSSDDDAIGGEEEFLLDDVETLPDEGGMDDDDAGSGDKTITIMFDDLSLGEAIRNICLAAEMKYRVEEFAVVIAGKDVPLDDLETRIYPVDSEADFGGEEAGGGGGTTSVKNYFERQGVLFPEGAEIVYDDAISRLIATNTPEQLRRIERIIDELNVVDPQVLIECKFVEFREDKHDEFGIAWTLGRPTNSSNDPERARTWQPNDQPLRFLNNPATGPLRDQDVLFDISKTTEKGLTFAAVGHAMDLQDDTNVLSCPRITTQNGEEATIRMVTEIYYPESWGEPTLLDSGAGVGGLLIAQVGYVSSMPEFGEPEEIGVRLTVTPTVDPDKYTITLDMIPVVQSQVGWVDYSYTQATSQGTVRNTVVMVIIEARTVTTQVTIYDGETIVMGGIMRDRVGTNNDKWPILGDIPLVGRYFQSQWETSRKENLLIFTTPRLVNPNGSPLRQREVRGKPPFRM